MQTISDYELLRLENIRRNHQFLDSIGISSLRPVFLEPNQKVSKPQKRHNRIEIVPSRKSPRLQQTSDISTKTHIIENPILTVDEASLTPLHTFEKIEVGDMTIRSDTNTANKVKRTAPNSILNPSSSRLLQADLSAFITKEAIGTAVGTTKAAVMQLANGGSSVPSFSKYSGVAEWHNAVFLWVNIGSEASEYPNVFGSQGRCITWYGGSQMRADSRIIERLVACSSSQDDQVLLFARLPGLSYICLGLLDVESMDLNVHPVVFVWRLRQLDELKKASPEFKKLLAANGIE